jgi:hypothetical protein
LKSVASKHRETGNVTLALGGREWLNLHAGAKSSKSARRKQVKSHPASSFQEYEWKRSKNNSINYPSLPSPRPDLSSDSIPASFPETKERKEKPLESINLYLTDVWNRFFAHIYMWQTVTGGPISP